MYDRELALEILTQIYGSTQTILKRFEPVKSVEDFTGSDGGMEKRFLPDERIKVAVCFAWDF